jgi:hypothetical protein
MSEDSFKARERAFEAVYFARINAELVEKIHRERETSIEKGLIASATGIEDETLLQQILDLGVDAKNIQALSLAPLVCIAWASGGLSRTERQAALDAAEAEGICRDSLSHPLFEAWLDDPPGANLFDTWRDYIAAVLEQLDEEGRSELRTSMIRRGRLIAKASGGFLGIGKISEKEKAVLEEIEVAMTE